AVTCLQRDGFVVHAQVTRRLRFAGEGEERHPRLEPAHEYGDRRGQDGEQRERHVNSARLHTAIMSVALFADQREVEAYTRSVSVALHQSTTPTARPRTA